MRSNHEMLKKLTEYVPLIAITSAFLAAVIGVYASYAVAEHNENEKSHPTLVQSALTNRAEIKLVSIKLDLAQQNNKEAHDRSDKMQERILDAIVTLQSQISAQ